jgi:ribosomal protein S18 acetylase RimI-like enzyme
LALIVALMIAALILTRVMGVRRGTWRYVLGGAVAAAAATQLLPESHPLRTDVADSSRNLFWVALGLVPVGIYAFFLRRLRIRTGLAEGARARADRRRPEGLVQVAEDAGLARETEAALAAEAGKALGGVPRIRSLGWRAADGSMAGHLRMVVCGETCEILLLHVGEAHRGHGVGTGLLRGAEAMGRELGARQIIIRVGSWQSLDFLRRFGFQTVWEQALGGCAKWCWLEKELS